jgi:REP element-mobilizing transposase RayT
MTLFQDKYRIESARLLGWDYSSPGAYFVTLCTKRMVNWFGDVVDGTMRLSPIGEIVADEWRRTEQIRPDVSLDQWIVMPNHLHGIVVIQETALVEMNERSSTSVETHRDASLQEPKRNRFGPQGNNLASIVRGFKSASTKRIHALGHEEFCWQPRYYDHIIRNEKSFNKIREYIANNVMQWESDRNHPSGLTDWM